MSRSLNIIASLIRIQTVGLFNFSPARPMHWRRAAAGRALVKLSDVSFNELNEEHYLCLIAYFLPRMLLLHIIDTHTHNTALIMDGSYSKQLSFLMVHMNIIVL